MTNGATIKQQVADCVFDYFTQYRPDDHRAQALCMEMLQDLETVTLEQSFLIAPLQQHWLKGNSQRIPLPRFEVVFALRVFYHEVSQIIAERDGTANEHEQQTLFAETRAAAHKRRMRGKLTVINGKRGNKITSCPRIPDLVLVDLD